MKRLRASVLDIAGPILRIAFSAALILAAWQLAASHVSHVFVSPPGAVGRSLLSALLDGTAFAIIQTTLFEALAGFAIGFVIGLSMAVVIGLSPALVGKVLEPIVTSLYATPKFVLAPILFLWLGADFAPRVFLVAIATFPVVAIYALSGIRTVDRDAVTMFELCGATKRQIAFKLLIPHTLSYVRTAVTFALPHAIEVAIGAEILFGSITGIGGMLNTTSNVFNATGVFTALVIGTALCFFSIWFVRWIGEGLIEGRFTRVERSARR